MEASFYDINGQPMVRILPILLERIVARDMKAVVRLSDEEALGVMNKALWSWGGRGGVAFLAHAASEDGLDEDDVIRQPIWLTCAAANRNKAQVLVLVDDAAPFPDDAFSRRLFMFDGTDAIAREKAFSAYKGSAAGGKVVWHENRPDGWQQVENPVSS